MSSIIPPMDPDFAKALAQQIGDNLHAEWRGIVAPRESPKSRKPFVPAIRVWGPDFASSHPFNLLLPSKHDNVEEAAALADTVIAHLINGIYQIIYRELTDPGVSFRERHKYWHPEVKPKPLDRDDPMYQALVKMGAIEPEQ